MADLRIGEPNVRARVRMRDANGNETVNYDVTSGIIWTSTDATKVAIIDDDADPHDASVDVLALSEGMPIRLTVSFDGDPGTDGIRTSTPNPRTSTWYQAKPPAPKSSSSSRSSDANEDIYELQARYDAVMGRCWNADRAYHDGAWYFIDQARAAACGTGTSMRKCLGRKNGIGLIFAAPMALILLASPAWERQQPMAHRHRKRGRPKKPGPRTASGQQSRAYATIARDFGTLELQDKRRALSRRTRRP